MDIDLEEKYPKNFSHLKNILAIPKEEFIKKGWDYTNGVMYMYRYYLTEVPDYNPEEHQFANDFKQYNSYLEFYEDTFTAEIDSITFLMKLQDKYISKILEYKNRFKDKKLAIYMRYEIDASKSWGNGDKEKSRFFGNIGKFVFDLNDIKYDDFVSFADFDNFDHEKSSQYWTRIKIIFSFWVLKTGGACVPLNDETRERKRSLIKIHCNDGTCAIRALVIWLAYQQQEKEKEERKKKLKKGEKMKRIKGLYDQLVDANHNTKIKLDGTMTGKNNILSIKTKNLLMNIVFLLEKMV